MSVRLGLMTVTSLHAVLTCLVATTVAVSKTLMEMEHFAVSLNLLVCLADICNIVSR